MGLFKDAKASMLTTEAERAIQEGRMVYVPKLNTPATAASTSGAVPGWAEMIEAVEACGWRLDQWSVAPDAKGRPEAYPLFRRA